MCTETTAVSRKDKARTENRKARIKCHIWCWYEIYFRHRLKIHSLKKKTCAMTKDVIKENLLHYHVGMLLVILHLLVLLNFFSHFLLYGHSCQWSVGTVKHVQSPSAFTISPAGCKMPVLISKNLWVSRWYVCSQFPVNTQLLLSSFWCYYKLSEPK